MAKAKRGAERREDALSRDRIVDAAIQLLDAEGENRLTFRALAARLATGPGAICWYVANKSELHEAASDAVIARALADVDVHAAPRNAIRKLAVGAHPWVGAQLSRGSWRGATLQIFEHVGRQLQALGAPRGTQFTAASVLVSYVISVSDQNAANGSRVVPGTDRAAFLELASAEWKKLDARDYAFTRGVAKQLRGHDDRAEFLAGIGA